jgi:osmotically inducible lipoprotein OsmB
MLTKFTTALAAGLLVAGAAASGARADDCSGHNHTAGTVLGAVGGGVIGGAITHGNIVGVAGGAVAGGLAGNAISRNMDCRHRHRYGYDRRRYWSERYHRYYYR